MTKTFTLFCLALITAFALSSCSAGKSFGKRKYTKGFFVSKNHKLPNTRSHELPRYQPTVVPAHPQQSTLVAELTPSHNTSRTIAPSSKENSGNGQHQRPNYRPRNLVPAPLQLRQPGALKPVGELLAQHPLAADSEDGLSLFWIVILIILILWALGLISGSFGAVINLLLVVALILLILWLLRIL